MQYTHVENFIYMVKSYDEKRKTYIILTKTNQFA